MGGLNWEKADATTENSEHTEREPEGPADRITRRVKRASSPRVSLVKGSAAFVVVTSVFRLDRGKSWSG